VHDISHVLERAVERRQDSSSAIERLKRFGIRAQEADTRHDALRHTAGIGA
jgi:hypothetical protein